MGGLNTFDRAIREFGTTWVYSQAGFILPDGTCLDFGPGPKARGIRGIDHSAVDFLCHGHNGWRSFISLGAISLNVSHSRREADIRFYKCTPAQLQVLVTIQELYGIRTWYIDKYYRDGTFSTACELHKPDESELSRVLQEISR